jgi:hypothetical protein
MYRSSSEISPLAQFIRIRINPHAVYAQLVAQRNRIFIVSTFVVNPEQTQLYQLPLQNTCPADRKHLSGKYCSSSRTTDLGTVGASGGRMRNEAESKWPCNRATGVEAQLHSSG